MAVLLVISTSAAAYHGVASIDLNGLLDAAWAHSRAALVFEQRKQSLINKSALSRQLFPSAAEVGGAFDSDAPFKNEGKKEYELRIETAIWLPGQQKALNLESDAEMGLLLANERFQRWKLAGKVREHYWNVMVARNNLKLAERKRQISDKLVSNVRKRVKAGELAEIDLLLSEQKNLAAESKFLFATQAFSKAQLLFNGLTGMDAPEDWLSETERQIQLEEHPLLVFIAEQLELSRANMIKIRSQKRAAPNIGLGFKRERDDRNEHYQNSIGFEFNLPLENKTINKSAFSNASTEKISIEVRYYLEKQNVAKLIEVAEQAVNHAKKSNVISERLKRLAVKHFKLMQSAFNVGEVGLRELLLVQNDSDQAVESSAQQRVEVARAISRLNQEQGGLP